MVGDYFLPVNGLNGINGRLLLTCCFLRTEARLYFYKTLRDLTLTLSLAKYTFFWGTSVRKSLAYELVDWEEKKYSHRGKACPVLRGKQLEQKNKEQINRGKLSFLLRGRQHPSQNNGIFSLWTLGLASMLSQVPWPPVSV